MLMVFAGLREQLLVLKSYSGPSTHLGPKEWTRKEIAPAPTLVTQSRKVSIWERALEKASCGKAPVPICCYLFPVCSSPNMSQKHLFGCFRTWVGVVPGLRSGMFAEGTSVCLWLPSHLSGYSLLLWDDIASQPLGVCSQKTLFKIGLTMFCCHWLKSYLY